MYYIDGWHPVAVVILGWLPPLLLLAAVAAVFVWTPRRANAESLTSRPGAPGRDEALETARIRFARGDIDREEYLRLIGDLGGPVRASEQPVAPSAAS